MSLHKIALTSISKNQLIHDFLKSVGISTKGIGPEFADSFNGAGIFDDLASAMYSVMDDKILDREELEQMLALYLSGLNPSQYWTRGRAKDDGTGVDKSLALLSAFNNRLEVVWNGIWGSKDKTTASIDEIKMDFRILKRTLKNMAKDEVREQAKQNSRTQSTNNDQSDGYDEYMENEISRSVSVGQTFNLNSWDEIISAGSRDEKVGDAVSKIREVFNNNKEQIANAVLDIAFVGERKTDAFERKLFLMGMGGGEYATKVETLFGDLTIDNKSVVFPMSNRMKGKDWVSHLAQHLIVIAYPELRHLIVPDMKGIKAKDQVLPEDLRTLTNTAHSKPFGNAHISFPSELRIMAAEIFGNGDATSVVSNFAPNQPYKNKVAVKSQNGVYAITPAMFKLLLKGADETLKGKWIRGKKMRKKPFWKRGMDSVLYSIQISEDTPITEWVSAKPFPAGVSSQTKSFVDDFQSDLLRILIDLNEAHGWYELRNKRHAKKEAKSHRLAHKVAYKWLMEQTNKKKRLRY